MTFDDRIKSIRRRMDLMTDYDRRLREKWVREWAATIDPGELVLDAGAGDGHLSSAFSSQTYVGLDIKPRRAEEGLPLVCGDLHQIPFRDGSVDHALSVQVLEHVRDPARVMRELSRVLKEGGTLCLSVPQGDPEHEQPHDYFRFTSFGLSNLAAEAELDVVSIKKKGGYFRRLSAEIRDLPFVILPEDRRYRVPAVAFLARALLVVAFTFLGATLLLAFDGLDRRGTYTTGYFGLFRKRRAG